MKFLLTENHSDQKIGLVMVSAKSVSFCPISSHCGWIWPEKLLDGGERRGGGSVFLL